MINCKKEFCITNKDGICTGQPCGYEERKGLLNEQRPDNKVLIQRKIFNDLNHLYEAKNHDYGDSFIILRDEFGPMSTAMRLQDKINRFKTLINAEAKVKDENIEDTLKDLINYTSMELIYRIQQKK